MSALGASPRSILVLTALALVAGGIAGALIDHKVVCRECADAAWSRRGASWTDDQLSRWGRTLDLTGAQRTELAGLLGDLKPRYDGVFNSVRRRRAAVDREFQDRLRKIVSGPQRSRLDEMIALDEKRHAQYYGPVPRVDGTPEPLGDDEPKMENASQ